MPRTVATAIAALGLAAILAACGSTPAASPPAASSPAPPSGEPPAVGPIPICADVPVLSAPADRYVDGPIYVANEMPVEEVRAWAIEQPAFVEIWIDRDHRGWITVGFLEAVDARQADLEREFPGVGVVAVEMDRTLEEFAALERRVQERLGPDVAAWSGTLITRGVVEIGVPTLTPARLAAIAAAFPDEPVCVTALSSSEPPAPGPQPVAGDGWRLLADELAGPTYRTGIAYDDASLAALWAEAGITAPLPEVDWTSEVVIWFGAVYGSGCDDLRLDDVAIVDDLVHAEIVVLGEPVACNADANPRAYVVAVERTRLPGPPFRIQLGPEDPPGGVPEERTVIDADLRVPGSVAAPEEVHGDPNLPPPSWVEAGDMIEPGFEVEYRMSVHCGVEWLGPLNGIEWRTSVPAGPTDWIPAEWATVVAMDGSIFLRVLMTPGPEPTVVATANGHEIVYRPADEPAPGCR